MQLRNRTPLAFPSTWAADQDWYAEPRRHRFQLEVRPAWGESNVRAYLIIGAPPQRLDMARGVNVGHSQRWFLDQPNPLVCDPSYVYAFEVTYRRFGFPRTRRLPAIGTLASIVALFGSVSWYQEGAHPSTAATAGEFYTNEFMVTRFVVQNLTPMDISVQAQITSVPNFFSILSSDPLPRVLSCGQNVGIGMRYSNWQDPAATQTGDVGILNIQATDVATGTVRLNTDFSFEGYVVGA